ncbi:MAG: RNA polymerase sigma factor [Ruminococcus sp.]|nr:RNA polymerase sigma factor [Ruminococcus sp.]MCR5016317.1 RNA polymerase sigma factor [Ruminococcus sp.]
MDNGASSYRRFLEGDKESIINIVSEYNNGLVLFLSSITGDICLAEELAEDVFCGLLLDKPRFGGKSSFKTWLYSIARYKALQMMKKAKRTADIPVDEMYTLTDEADIEREHIRNEQKIAVHRAMKRIASDYSQVLYLTYFEGFNNTETAKIMKKNNRQIENLLYRAKSALRAELEKEGFVYEEL